MDYMAQCYVVDLLLAVTIRLTCLATTSVHSPKDCCQYRLHRSQTFRPGTHPFSAKSSHLNQSRKIYVSHQTCAGRLRHTKLCYSDKGASAFFLPRLPLLRDASTIDESLPAISPFFPPTSKNNPYMQAASNPRILCLPRDLYPAFVERCSDLGSPSEWSSTMLPPRRSRANKNTPVPVSAPRPLAVQIRFHTDP